MKAAEERVSLSDGRRYLGENIIGRVPGRKARKARKATVMGNGAYQRMPSNEQGTMVEE